MCVSVCACVCVCVYLWCLSCVAIFNPLPSPTHCRLGCSLKLDRSSVSYPDMYVCHAKHLWCLRADEERRGFDSVLVSFCFSPSRVTWSLTPTHHHPHTTQRTLWVCVCVCVCVFVFVCVCVCVCYIMTPSSRDAIILWCFSCGC